MPKILNEELSKQIIGSEHSILSLYEIASALETLNPEEIYTETMGLLSKFLQAKTVSIYTVDKRQEYLRLKIRMGKSMGLNNSIKVDHYEHFKTLLHTKEIIRLNPGNKEDAPLLSAPLTSNGEIIAVINVEELDFNLVTDYTYNLFKIIVSWINKALVQAVEAAEVMSGDNYYENTRIMNMEEFNKRVEEEKRRMQKFDLEYALLSLKSGNYTIVDFDAKIKKLIRQIDVVGYDQEKDLYHIMLPVTPRDEVPKIEERIFGGFDYVLEKVL